MAARKILAFIVNTYPSPMIVEYIDLSELVEIQPEAEKGNNPLKRISNPIKLRCTFIAPAGT